MKKTQNNNSSNNKSKVKNGSNNTNGFLPNSLKFISSCIKTVSSNVRSASATVAGSSSDDHRKDQVLWACFDRLELGLSSFKRVLLIGYSDGFQVLDVEDASNVCELVSRRDDPVTFLQMQPIPAKADGREGYKRSHPLLLVVACDDTADSASAQTGRDAFVEPQGGSIIHSPTTVRFYSLRSHSYVHVLRFRSTVYMVRCSPKVVAVGLAAQIYCFDALTLENKFSVLTYPVPQLGVQGVTGVNIGYGPMAVGPRWLAYASNNPLLSNTGRLSPQSLSPSPGVSPSTSPGNGNLVARYAMESSKHLATGLINLGDMGYKTLSKYCNELLPDGSNSPVSASASWKVGRVPAHSTETDAAGMVVIKDFVSRAVISQFRAHTSPISALCFDPSGTLLVTASTRGNNINIFRIVPSCSNGTGNQSSDWKASHAHLYKLHRGVTPAVIQDICFSHYSQWVAIISSRGTCHLFVLSPFGGETGLQLQNSHVDGPILLPILSGPWWSRSSFTVNQQSNAPAPAPITLSVVNRIKNSGWLNTVSNVTSSAAGKASVPSGVLSAVFHSSVCREQPAPQNLNALEHLLAYTPSGHLIQYELMPSFGGHHGDSYLRTGTASVVQMQEDDTGVKVDPIQWWDVCRRADWPEREECVHGITLGGREATDIVMRDSLSEDDDTGEKDSAKLCDRSHWYLSNAEVQLRSGRIPIWQKSKIYFCTMSLSGYEDQDLSRSLAAGEIEIEKIPVNEVEIRRKDLLPVFDHFHRISSKWSDDSSAIGKEKSGDTATGISRADSLSEKSFPSGSSQVPGLHEVGMGPISYPCIELSMEESDGLRSSSFTLAPQVSNKAQAALESSPVEDPYVVNSPSPPKSESFSTGGTSAREVQSSNSVITSEASNSSSNRSDLSMNIIDEQTVHDNICDPVDFGQFFQEGYCKASTNNELNEVTELVADMDSSSSPCNKEKPDDDGDSDDMLGGVFDFSEEG
ncbi:autophagy-related protein 18h-like [Lycium barbarum]|uniref:autophagy-related protein 18h-like n=1 Tax=Lycium barbarum TaxID=112863 RepID=UPI00293EB905|nr:autophagy-related protein 18h-like [Lycium barbarum]